MKRIALHDAEESTKYPNLALMKLSSFHKKKGDLVEWYNRFFSNKYDTIYSSKVFTFKKSEKPIGNTILGGVGYNLFNTLSEEIEHTCPDYSLYDTDCSYGFLTRGCPNKCKWCIVPTKEGDIRKHADIEEFLKHKKVVLMDNNVLASNHGISQIEKIGKLNIKVDFNQGIDARLIDDGIARRLSKLKWSPSVRLACDSNSQMKYIEKAVKLLRWHNTRPVRYFVYCLMEDDVDEIWERLQFLKGLYLEPFVQPFIDFNGGDNRTKEQKKFCRWVNHTAIFNSIEWEEYNINFKNNNVLESGLFSQEHLKEHCKIKDEK